MKKLLLLAAVVAALSFTPAKVYICISTGATKYHSGMCRGLKQCTHEIKQVTVEEAVSRGYGPCGWCY